MSVTVSQKKELKWRLSSVLRSVKINPRWIIDDTLAAQDRHIFINWLDRHIDEWIMQFSGSEPFYRLPALLTGFNAASLTDLNLSLTVSNQFFLYSL